MYFYYFIIILLYYLNDSFKEKNEVQKILRLDVKEKQMKR